MPKIITNLAFDNPGKWSRWTEDNYRKDAATSYKEILNYPRDDISCDQFIALVYKTLEAFNMNTKGAKLSALPDFTKAIKGHISTIQSLAGLRLEEVKESEGQIKVAMNSLFEMFDNHQLVRTESPLVTFSKTMHFFLPDLFMPIDRKYTLQFFYKEPPYKSENYGMHHLTDTIEKQKQCFLQVFEQFRQFAHEHHETLKAQVDKTSRWNHNIPKVIDNIIIAYVSEKME